MLTRIPASERTSQKLDELLTRGAGFAPALTVLSGTCIIGIVVLGFMRDARPTATNPV